VLVLASVGRLVGGCEPRLCPKTNPLLEDPDSGTLTSLLQLGLGTQVSYTEAELLPEIWQRLSLLATRPSKSFSDARSSVRISEASRVERSPNDAEFFDGFPEAESSYDAGALGALDDFEPGRHGLFNEDVVKSQEFFDESASAGSAHAFQTHYPALNTGIAGREFQSGQWLDSSDSTWHQEHVSAQSQSDGTGHGYRGRSVPKPSWFDSSVKQYDGYGRKRAPEPNWYGQSTQWVERTVNTTVSCADIGCTANSTLTAFNPSREMARNCRLNFAVHPTDFDDQYSRENVDMIAVNGITLKTNCDPMLNGCADGTQDAMYECLGEQLVDHIVKKANGTLVISARISPLVDECPYQGNLLSGVASVTCMVAPKPTAPPGSTPAPVLATPANRTSSPTYRVPLQCPDRGCRARAVIRIEGVAVTSISDCSLRVKFNQTDFDGDAGALERIEYIRVDGVDIKTNVTPGKNPCKERRNGTALTAAEVEYTAVPGRDVDADAADRAIVVEAKISDHVDECASNGYLLDGWAELTCTLVQSAHGIGASQGTTKNVTSDVGGKSEGIKSDVLAAQLAGRNRTDTRGPSDSGSTL